MSLEFNRRSFLKYSAAAAVVVAGSSLLTGCGDDEYQPTGTLGSTLKLMGQYTMNNAKLADSKSYNAVTKTATYTTTFADDTTAQAFDLVCPLTMKCTSKYGIRIEDKSFQVEVLRNNKTVQTYRAGNTDGTGFITLSHATNYLEKDDSLDTVLVVSDISLLPTDTIKVKFWPRAQASEGTQSYTRAFVTWTIKVDSSNNDSDSENRYITKK